MGVLETVETKIEPLFKGAPSLSDASRNTLVGIWPVLALVFGVIQLFAAAGLWNLIEAAERIGLFKSYYAYAPTLVSESDKTMIYIAIVILLVDALILLMAYPNLKKRQRHGWNLLFLGMLLNVGYAVTNLFISTRGFSSFLLSMTGSIVGLYLLYQIKGKYGSVKNATEK